MTMHIPSPTPADAVAADLAETPDGVLEAVAERHGVPLRAVLDALPAENRRVLPGAGFEDIWHALGAWGPVMVIIHTRDGVFEVKAALPPGTMGRGTFNVHGDSPLGGHLRAERCAAIYLIDRPFFGRRSCSVQFVNVDGGVMFKVFVARDADRALDPEQLARFEALWAQAAS